MSEQMIKTRMLVMRPDRPHETLERELPADPSYKVLRELLTPLLDGALLEHTRVLADFDGGTTYEVLDMFVDEVGQLKQLPRNESATTLYRRANLMGQTAVPPVSDPEMLHSIVGPAVLFDRLVWF